MKLSLLLAAGVAAAPAALERRKINDFEILNYALTLEHLEATFYTEALRKFDADDFKKAGYDPKVHFNLMEVMSDEDTHVKFLTEAIKGAGGKPVKRCTYDFGLTDVPTFMQTAGLLEGVGITAYLGAAQYIMSKEYLTAAGSVLTVESRHSSYIRSVMKRPQSPFPQPFDVPLDFNEVYSLASLFIKSCPSTNTQLPPLKAFPTLAVATGETMPRREGMSLELETEKPLKGDLYAAFITVTGPIFEKAKADGKKIMTKIPKGVSGQSYVVITHSDKTVSDDNILAGPGVVAIQAPYTYGGFPMES